MNKSREILLKYWGYSSFRPLQEEIINAVIEKKDVLALLPTGGGKSICYQIPALVMDGICVVVSPIISLIKDQVESLKSRGIIAVSVHSGMHKREIDIALDYCIYGKPKFLFVSPERLETELFKVRVQKMKVNLIAIDEAHCISQWGYDFRPSYLKISDIRSILPNVPLLALTATATPNVVEDIQDKLKFKNGIKFFQSFERQNLIYVCRKTDNKYNEVIHICEKLKGTGIIYVRSRRRTTEIANELEKKGISTTIYHAGLKNEIRAKHQEDWKKDKVRIIVATNAFGMGIDKPDVRFVIHFDLPNAPEAYFQEAGRGGRDGKLAYAIIIFNENDITDLNYFHELSFPDKDIIRKIYLSIGNFYKLAVGSGMGESFGFDIKKFCEIYPFKPIEIISALKILELDGYLEISDAVFTPSRVKIEVTNFDLYNFQLKNNTYEPFIKLLLRKYPGLFDEFARISEADLATALNTSINKIKSYLTELNSMSILNYIEQTDLPFLTWMKARVPERDFRISKEVYDIRKNNDKHRNETIISYVKNTSDCRSTLLLNYFHEKPLQRCGKCDNCVKLNKLELSNIEFEKLCATVLNELKNGAVDLNELKQKTIHFDYEHLSKVLNWLLDNKKIYFEGNMVKLTE